MPGEWKLGHRGEDADLTARGVVDEHRLGEVELVRDALALRLGDLAALEEDSQRVAALALGRDEDLEDVEQRRQRIGRKFSISYGVTCTR